MPIEKCINYKMNLSISISKCYCHLICYLLRDTVSVFIKNLYLILLKINFTNIVYKYYNFLTNCLT